MSEPTVSSISADRSMDKAMGWSSQNSGGRGKRGYENANMSRRKEERMKEAKKTEENAKKEKEVVIRKGVNELMRQADAGELDWM